MALVDHKLQQQGPRSGTMVVSPSKVNQGDRFEVTFKQGIINELPQSVHQVALLVTPEYEGIFRNGGIGTYYRTLSEKLAAAGFHIILILCQSKETFAGQTTIQALNHIFSSHECKEVLALSSTHLAILTQLNDRNAIDYENYCALFFAQAIATTFPDAYIYIEFPEMMGLGYRTVQAKRSGILRQNCVVAVTLHSGQEWLQEAHAQYAQYNPQWFWQTSHYEQYSFEQADLAFFLSHFLKEKVGQYGWQTDHALHLPYCFQVFEQASEIAVRRDLQQLVEDDAIPLVFFGRLEERKGLLTFLEALTLLKPSVIEKIHVLFLGKSMKLQAEGLQEVDSQNYIRQRLGADYHYHVVTDLFSQEAIQWVNQMHYPIICLASHQENFPHTALEMGQLPIRLVISDTGGFRETLDLIERTSGVHWFNPGDARSLAQAINAAISLNPETITCPQRDVLQYINQRLLLQRVEYMWQASIRTAAPAGLEPEKDKPRQWILGMTSTNEQVYLETYAQNQYSGQGEIVELGCWLGSSTISLAMGLKQNLQVINRASRIHAYDIFIWYSSHNMERSVSGTSVAKKYKDGDSFLDEYLLRIYPWSDLIKVHPGDLTQLGWDQRPIELLFIDAMKSWELANSILKDFFPSLIPGLSLVVHQDFAHFYQVWIHLTMYRLREYFTPLENHPFLYSSVVFRYVKAIPEEQLNASYSLASFSEKEAEAAFEYSMSITPKQMQPNIAAAKVMYFIQAGKAERAKLELRQARATFDTENWWNLIEVEDWLDRGDWFKQYRT
jgi:glycosyltransferase involved in cell wall biosynthesis